MENRLTDLGPRHFWQYFPSVIQNNYGKWLYHDILEPGILVHVCGKRRQGIHCTMRWMPIHDR